MVQRLLSGKREGATPTTSSETFERALEERFTVERTEPVSETRTLYEARPRVSDGASGGPRCTSAGCGRSRSPSRCSTCSGATRSSSSRAGARRATSCCSRSATRSCRRWCGARLVWALGRIRPALGWARMLVFVALLVAALVLPPVGDLLGGSAVAVPVALLVGAGAAALYARAARRALVRHGPLARAAGRPGPVPRRLAGRAGCCSRGRGGGAVGGPVALHDADRAGRASTSCRLTHADRRRRQDRRRAVPELRARSRATSTWYRNATTVDDLTAEAVPAQLTGEQPRRGRAADAARPPAQPVHAVRAQPPADGGRADHRRLPGAAVRRGRGRTLATG